MVPHFDASFPLFHFLLLSSDSDTKFKQGNDYKIVAGTMRRRYGKSRIWPSEHIPWQEEGQVARRFDLNLDDDEKFDGWLKIVVQVCSRSLLVDSTPDLFQLADVV